MAEETGLFVFLDPHDALCDKNGFCQNISNDSRLLYSDIQHLSKAGSRHVISFFKPQILTLLNKPQSTENKNVND